MKKEHLNIVGTVSALLLILGLFLMFFSVGFGMSLGESWLISQSGGSADTNQYMMVIETYTNNFVIIGSMLFGAGLLTALFIFYSFLRYGSKDR